MTNNSKFKLNNFLGNSRTWWYAILASIAVLSIDFRLLVSFGYHTTSLLYIGVPFMIALILVYFHKPYKNASWQRIHRNFIIDGFIIMMGSSIVLAEGFICVVIFMPIYLVILAISYGATAAFKQAQDKKSKTLGVSIIPLIIFISAFEGINPETSFNRQEQVSVTRIVKAPVSDIKGNLVKPIELQKDRPWFLELFPMPYKIEAESLKPGDIHVIHLRYYRWFITNVHEGSMQLEISDVEDNRIRTTFINDSSYFSNYLTLESTEITLQVIDNLHTEVTLSIDYTRKLDPYWYFSPIGRYGVGLAAEFLIAEVIGRENK